MNATDYEIAKDEYDGFIFDLDGVITQTAKIHAAAWKELFDEYLESLARREGKKYTPFDAEGEYRRYVDGKPRYDGVQSFLESRGIRIPWGTTGDGPDMETVCGLGNRKNRIFQKHLKNGVEVYEDAQNLIRELKDGNWKLAVISASKNCKPVLEAAGAGDWFDVMVDGVASEEIGLAGKPEPDIFFEAAGRLDLSPVRVVVAEDAFAGVKAGKKGGFGRVIGVDRGNNEKTLREGGADIVVSSLSEIRISNEGSIDRKKSMDALPSALDEIEDIVDRMDGKQPAVFLDYDGVLTPIVNDPEKAFLSDRMRATLKMVSEHWFIAVVSGRDLKTIQNFVKLETVYYAGSHGFDIAGPSDRHITMRKGDEFLSALDQAQKRLEKRLSGVEGALIERKKYSIAIHYRNVSDDQFETIREAVEETRSEFSELRRTSGKKVFELQPDIEWNKGKAVLWLMETLNLDLSRYYPIYIGDDITDEDAFEALSDFGPGVVVKGGDHPTSARYVLENPEETATFLKQLISLFGKDTT